MAILKHIPIKNRYYSSAVEYLTCQFDEYKNEPILDEKGRIMEREEYLIEGINCGVILLEQNALRRIDSMVRIMQ